MPHINSLVYDFEGTSPASVMIPHVVCSVAARNSHKPRYNGVFPLDTGAKSDITFNSTLRDQIEQYSEKFGLEVSVAVAPLSAIKQKKHSYHAEHEPHVGGLDVGRVLRAQTLAAAFRGDNKTTLSLKALKLAGRCVVVDPSAAEPVVITDYLGPKSKIEKYGGTKSVYSTDVQFADNLEGFQFHLSCNQKRIDTLAMTNFMRPDRLLSNKKKEDVRPGLRSFSKAVCWDTGAAFSTFPGPEFEDLKLGKIVAKNRGVIEEISFLDEGKHTLLRCRNVPVRLDYPQFIIGAPILNLFRMGFDPSGAKIGLSLLWPHKWIPYPVRFNTEGDRATFISWEKPE